MRRATPEQVHSRASSPDAPRRCRVQPDPYATI